MGKPHAYLATVEIEIPFVTDKTDEGELRRAASNVVDTYLREDGRIEDITVSKLSAVPSGWNEDELVFLEEEESDITVKEAIDINTFNDKEAQEEKDRNSKQLSFPEMASPDAT